MAERSSCHRRQLKKSILIGLSLSLLSFGFFAGLVGCGNANTTQPGQTPEATVQKAEVILEDEPGPELIKAATANIELGLGYLSQGQIARAKAKLNYALKLSPTIPETHSAMAYFFEKAGENVESEKEHKKAIKYSTNKGAVYNNYGAFLCRKTRYKEADSAFKRALEDKNYPRSAEVYENAGVCALKGGDIKAGEAYLHTALKQDTSRSLAVMELAALNLQQQNFQLARELLNHYKMIAEPNARSLWLSIQAADALGDQDSVASSALLLKNSFENSPEFQEYLNSDIGK